MSGIFGSTLTEKVAYVLGRSRTALATTEGVRSIDIGRDGRTHSLELETAPITA